MLTYYAKRILTGAFIVLSMVTAIGLIEYWIKFVALSILALVFIFMSFAIGNGIWEKLK